MEMLKLLLKWALICITKEALVYTLAFGCYLSPSFDWIRSFLLPVLLICFFFLFIDLLAEGNEERPLG